MDVSRKSFQWQLPRILRALANTHFVSMDLELSGIQSKPKRKSRTTGDINGKQSLQQRYEEAKEAAEKYQVLQVGLTCVSEDQENGKMLRLCILYAKLYGTDSSSEICGSALQLLFEPSTGREV